MAVVFISPKQRQKAFLVGITVVLMLFLVVISLGVFLAKPGDFSPQLVFNKPKVSIDTSIFDSDQFKNLQPFTDMQKQYSYKATTKDGKPQIGFVSADTIDHARNTLEAQGLTVSELKEVEVGRDNPFTPYYQPVVTPTIVINTAKTQSKIPTKSLTKSQITGK